MPTPEEMINQGGEVVDLNEPQQIESTKITTETPIKVTEDPKPIDNLPVDPIERFKAIVTEKGEKIDEKKEKELEEKKEVEKEEEIPPTAKFPRPKLEEQLKDEDLSDVDPSALEYFKKMDKSARAYVKARLKENQELKEKLSKTPAGLPQNWFDHEEAYTLQPEFRRALALSTRAGQETEYWKAQLRKVRNGDKWHDLEQDKDGRLVQVEMDPDVNSEDELNSRIREGERLQREYSGQAISLKEGFSNQRLQVQTAIKSIESKFFPQYREDKEYDKNKYVKQMRDTLSKFNQSGNVLSGFITDLYRFALERCDELVELSSKEVKKEERKKDQLRAGPTSEEIQGGRSKEIDPDDKPFNIKEFEKLKQGLA